MSHVEAVPHPHQTMRSGTARPSFMTCGPWMPPVHGGISSSRGSGACLKVAQPHHISHPFCVVLGWPCVSVVMPRTWGLVLASLRVGMVLASGPWEPTVAPRLYATPRAAMLPSGPREPTVAPHIGPGNGYCRNCCSKPTPERVAKERPALQQPLSGTARMCGQRPSTLVCCVVCVCVCVCDSDGNDSETAIPRPVGTDNYPARRARASWWHVGTDSCPSKHGVFAVGHANVWSEGTGSCPAHTT